MGLTLIGGILLALLGWSAWHHATPEVRSGLLGFSVVDDTRVDVRFEVVADPSASLVCDLRARDVGQATVGSVAVAVGPAPAPRRQVQAAIPTRQRAVSGELQGCRVVPR